MRATASMEEATCCLAIVATYTLCWALDRTTDVRGMQSHAPPPGPFIDKFRSVASPVRFPRPEGAFMWWRCVAPFAAGRPRSFDRRGRDQVASLAWPGRAYVSLSAPASPPHVALRPFSTAIAN